MINGKLIWVNGTEIDIYPIDGVVFSSAECSRHIGGGCRVVRITPVQHRSEPMKVMVIDSEAMLHIQTPNLLATQIYLRGRYRMTEAEIKSQFETNIFKLPTIIRGNVILCDPNVVDIAVNNF